MLLVDTPESGMIWLVTTCSATALRWVLVLGLLVTLSACSNKSSPSVVNEDAFYKAVFADRNFSILDTTSVSDEKLLAGGRDFCDRLREIAKTNTDKNLERPNSEDFGPTAEAIADSRFSEVTRLPTSPGGNGPILLAYTVGQAAVKHLCPEYEAALG